MLNPTCSNPCRVIFAKCSWHPSSMWILQYLWSRQIRNLICSQSFNLYFSDEGTNRSWFFWLETNCREAETKAKQRHRSNLFLCRLHLLRPNLIDPRWNFKSVRLIYDPVCPDGPFFEYRLYYIKGSDVLSLQKFESIFWAPQIHKQP